MAAPHAHVCDAEARKQVVRNLDDDVGHRQGGRASHLAPVLLRQVAAQIAHCAADEGAGDPRLDTVESAARTAGEVVCTGITERCVARPAAGRG